MKNLAIIGAGSWGTALSIALAPRFPTIRLWVYEPDLADRIAAARQNDVYLPGFAIPSNVLPTTNLEEALGPSDLILSVVPSHLTRGLYSRMLPHLDPGMSFVSATKGVETQTLQRMSQVIRDVVSVRFEPRVAVISGPTFAREVAAGEPTALVVASDHADIAAAIQAAFSGPAFRLYTSSDPIGVELGGAIKNVIAIGAGVLHGLSLGHNALAALITRGLAEMTRLAVALGGKPHTLAGLAGLGDLVLTCNGELSRNRTVGIELAKGRNLDEIVASMRMIAEGIKTTGAAVELADRAGIEMPIATQMYRMLHHGVSPRDAIRALMERSLRDE